MRTRSASQTLQEAAEYLEAHGWVQGKAYQPGDYDNPPACAFGAVCRVRGGAYELTYLLREIGIEPRIGRWDLIGEVAHWNDAPERTPTEVIDTLRFAAKRAREDEDAE